jgi:serine/threonine protein kinase
MEEFKDVGCAVLGLNTDSIETHQRWLQTSPENGGLGPIDFPLASDSDGALCRQYGVYVERQHLAQRGMFIVDPNGVLQYQVVHSLSVGRSTDEVLRVLDALQSGGLCPAEREIGQETIGILKEVQPNRVIGTYRIESEIGRGSFGAVFRARDILLDRAVALKILRPQSEIPTDALLEEARTAAALNHPNVCAIYSIDKSVGPSMIVMEHVDGQPLSERLKLGPLDVEQVASYGRQFADGMAAAHAVGVVHGDLKPANLMVTPDERIKIMDFGLARRTLLEPSPDETVKFDSSHSGLSGTPGYMAPEQARGEPTSPATDVFAMGLVIYEMVTGKPAITGKNILDVLRKLENFEADEFVAEAGAPFGEIMNRALRRDSAERRITMEEIAEYFGRVRQGI